MEEVVGRASGAAITRAVSAEGELVASDGREWAKERARTGKHADEAPNETEMRISGLAPMGPEAARIGRRLTANYAFW